MVLEVMIETSDYSVPKTSDLEDWADEYGLTMPGLADANGEQMWKYAADMGGSVGLPFTVVIDEGVVIDTIANGSQESSIRHKLRPI